MSVKRVAITGIGGYGLRHVQAALKLVASGEAEIAAFCETKPDLYTETIELLKGVGAKQYSNFSQMLSEVGGIDIITIAAPIHLHLSMAAEALNSGIHVYLEKPPVVTIQDFVYLLHTQQESRKLCAVGFQNTAGSAFLRLIELIQTGKLGTLRRITGIGLRKRFDSYFLRSYWAGKLKIGESYNLDGCIFNALSHLVQNCLIAAGAGDPLNAQPVRIRAELYHAHAVEGEDTACIHIDTACNVPINIYLTYLSQVNETPEILIDGERGSALWKLNDNTLLTKIDNTESLFDGGKENLMLRMLSNLIASIDGKESLYCSLQKCKSFILAGNGAYLSSNGASAIPSEYIEYIHEDKGTLPFVPGLCDTLRKCAAEGILLSDAGVPWARKKSSFSVENFDVFSL